MIFLVVGYLSAIFIPHFFRGERLDFLSVLLPPPLMDSFSLDPVVRKGPLVMILLPFFFNHRLSKVLIPQVYVVFFFFFFFRQ